MEEHGDSVDHLADMSFLEKVARIRTELLGAPADMSAAQVVGAAMPLMGIVVCRADVGAAAD